MTSAKHSWILGASSGIGAALARELASRGERVCISARNAEALAALASSLPGTGHLALPVDVSDADALKAASDNLWHDWGRIDRVIFMAGLYTPMELAALDLAETERIVKVNLLGAFYLVAAALPHLTAQGNGQLALCASVAGYRGLPGGQPYGATKAGLINLAESLRAEQGKTLDIRVINPGFVESRLTAKNTFRMPMQISAAQAAVAIANGLNGRSFEIHFPKGFTLIMKLLRLLPHWLYFRIVA
ncbi:MAG: SDR family NAD(P)-dependent oxidoreductase [Alphaproteobacteria bacterium]